jgi:SAM-dependent methyltransferase
MFEFLSMGNVMRTISTLSFGLLPDSYIPNHSENRMKNEGDVLAAREHYLSYRPANLTNLLKQRYSWMENFLPESGTVIELGSGHGLIQEFLPNKKILLSDVRKTDFVDLEIDALNIKLAPRSVDVFICSHMIHHVAKPAVFLKSLEPFLKAGGLVVIQEINTSFFMKVLLRMMRHEGWSYRVDVFDSTQICNVPDDPWSANCAIPELLFSDGVRFEKEIPQFKLIKNELCEFLALPLSGGVISKTRVPLLPQWILSGVNLIDTICVKLFPGLFAFGRRVVLQKVGE